MLLEIKDFIADLFLILGIFLVVSSAIGMVRMKDYYTRAHAISITDSLALPVILIGILLKMEPDLNSVKIIIIIIFSTITAATACHAITKAAIFESDPDGHKDKNYAAKVKEIREREGAKDKK